MLKNSKNTPPQGGAIPCWQFFPACLGVTLTPAQRVLVKVCVDGIPFSALTDEEWLIAQEMFGVSDRDTVIPPAALALLVWLLGRGSGKSTLIAGIALYLSMTLPIHKAGRKSVPVFFIIAPNKKDAVDVTLSFARQMVLDGPLKPYLVADKESQMELLRPDGNLVRIEAVAPMKGGSNVRGRNIIGYMLDEAQFFNSDPSGRYLVNDRDVVSALTPRMMLGSKGFMVSTPWPSENLMSEYVERHFGAPGTCLVAKAPTFMMRPDDTERVTISYNQEFARDPANARREYYCDTESTFTGAFFDLSALKRASVEEVSMMDPQRCPTAACIDLAFLKDSSTIVIVQYQPDPTAASKGRFVLVHMRELMPKEGIPLKFSEVMEVFCQDAKAHGCRYVLGDSTYQEAVREAFQKVGISLYALPAGRTGKDAQYLRTKAMLDEDRVTIGKNNPLYKRFLSQASAIVARAGGDGKIHADNPRKSGVAHCDIVSSWVGAVHHLSYAAVREVNQTPKRGEEGYAEWLTRRRAERDRLREEAHVKSLEKSYRKPSSWRFV